MRRIISFVCLITLTCGSIATAAPKIPWKLFNEPAMLRAATFAHIAPCLLQNGEVFMAGFETENHAKYVMAYEPVSGRIAFVFKPKGSPDPTEIGLGYVDLKTPGQHNVIPQLTWIPFVHAQHNDACQLLFNSGV